MSKDTPEVGDVYYIKPYPHLKYRIVRVGEYKKSTYYILFNGIETSDIYKTELNKRFIYLGKSKANIDDLFKTEDLRCSEEN